MKFKSKNIAIRAGTFYVAVFHVDDAKDLDLWPTDRVEMRKGKRMITCIIDVARGEKVVRPGTVALYYETSQKLKTNPFDAVEVLPMPTPPSVRFIKQKLDGKQLNYEQMHEIIKAISENDLTDTEMTYFISACYNKGLSIREIEHLTKAMVVTGDIMKPAKSPVFDKHCLTEDTPLVFRFNNKIMVEPIGKLVEILEIHQKYKPKNGAWSMPISRNIQVLVFNENGKTNFAKATELFKARAPRELNKLVLKGNKEIKLTSDHTVFVLKNGQIINLPVSKINKGDFVVVPSGHSVKKRKLLKSNNLILNKKSLSSFLTLLGFYVAEGFSNYQGFFLNFGSHEKNLIKESMQCIKQVFRINPTINIPHPTARRVCVYRKNLSAFFEGLGCGKNALEKRIPSFIFDLPREDKLIFLRALFRGDGYTRRGYESIYVTSSEMLSNDLQYLLTLMNISCSLSTSGAKYRNFGKIKSFVQKSFYIYTQAREIFGKRERTNVAFTNLLPIQKLGEIDTSKIGWENRRIFKRQKYITKQKLRDFEDFILNKDVKKLINGDISVLEVKANTKIKSTSEFVYDIKVPGYEKFAAGTSPIFIHNCIGGIPGNRTTPLIVPIIAAAGLTIPKTSSRSITSPSGTADTMEVLCNVTIPLKKMKQIVDKVGGCVVWGGALNLAPADDNIIKIEHPMALDAEGNLLASILAKKLSVSSSRILIDIPVARDAKVTTRKKAERLKNKFYQIAKHFGLKIRVIITDGTQPIGKGIGPALEARDILRALKNDEKAPLDLIKKSTWMAGILLEIGGKAKPGKGTKKALEILKSGQAYKKFCQIVNAQGANYTDPDKIPLGKFTKLYRAPKSGRIMDVDNRKINPLARALGAPVDKGAGIYLYKNEQQNVKKRDKLFKLYSRSRRKLNYGIKLVKKNYPYKIK